MRFSVGIALMALVLGGCAGTGGNPNGLPYANEAGGAMAVAPQTRGTESYNPYAPAPPFADMQTGQAAINPPPPSPVPGATRPAR